MLVAEWNLILSREEFDHHLDTMQVDLDHLREVLSQQGNPIDASSLLGVCDTIGLSFEPTLGGWFFQLAEQPGHLEPEAITIGELAVLFSDISTRSADATKGSYRVNCREVGLVKLLIDSPLVVLVLIALKK